ncbi:hypothetical protein NKK52_30755 [Mesorhizobium sp. C277A]|uniref:hypothetical protein n=1 Tax=Mesorhizobium sp. C277A TaxID=2956827 RepID=UPI001AEBD41E|nr:hypothetical protein [Mesorhizobium sp. LSJC277A00]
MMRDGACFKNARPDVEASTGSGLSVRGYSRSTAATAATIDLSRCEHADLDGGHSVRLKRSAHLIRHRTGLRNLDFQACSWVCTVSALTARQVRTPLEAIVWISRAIPAPTAGV